MIRYNIMKTRSRVRGTKRKKKIVIIKNKKETENIVIVMTNTMQE